MGIFSDKCTALVDPSTKRALSGAVLEDARREKKWPRCGNRVRKAARFCNVCGSPAPGGWWRCPSCNKWIGNDSSFCPHCDAALYPEDRSDMAGGVWAKSVTVFAKRFEIGDIKRLLKKNLQVQTGTVALMLDGGEYKGSIDAGQHNPDSLARRINHFGSPPPRSVVLMDTGEVIVPIRFEGLQTADPYPVEFYGEMIVRFAGDNKSALAFLGNMMKEQRELSYEDILQRILPDIRHAVDALCVKSMVDDLVRDPERRLRLEDEISRYAETALVSCGMKLVRMSAVEFTGEAYDSLTEKMGEVEIARREMEYDQRMRELLSKEQMASFTSERELRDYQETLAHEYGIAHERREREQRELIKGWERHDQLDDLRHQFAVRSEEQEQDLGLKVQWEDYEQQRMVTVAETDADVRRIAFEQEKSEKAWADQREHNEVEWAMKLRKEKELQKADVRQRDADRRNGMDELQLVADIEDPEQRKSIMDVLRLKAQSGMTPEQLLALAAERSDKAADALVGMKEGKEEVYNQLLDEMKTLYADVADRQDRNLKTMIEPAVEAAKRKDGDKTIVK